MDFNALRLVTLFAAIAVLAGCASTQETSEDYSPALEQVPTHDDSHGWGANIGNLH
jgi:ABC-type uncharacterized transport system auxiliary subunit